MPASKPDAAEPDTQSSPEASSASRRWQDMSQVLQRGPQLRGKVDQSELAAAFAVAHPQRPRTFRLG
jgi:hypothetical protein